LIAGDESDSEVGDLPQLIPLFSDAKKYKKTGDH